MNKLISHRVEISVGSVNKDTGEAAEADIYVADYVWDQGDLDARVMNRISDLCKEWLYDNEGDSVIVTIASISDNSIFGYYTPETGLVMG